MSLHKPTITIFVNNVMVVPTETMTMYGMKVIRKMIADETDPIVALVKNDAVI